MRECAPLIRGKAVIFVPCRTKKGYEKFILA